MDLYRQLARTWPDLHRADFIDTLEQAAVSLLTQGRPAEALPILDEALETLAASPEKPEERKEKFEQLRGLLEQAAGAVEGEGLITVFRQELQ